MKIAKQTPIKELLKAHPQTAEIMMAYGLYCVNCHFSEFDTVEDGAKLHGLSEEDVKLMIKDIDEIVKKKV